MSHNAESKGEIALPYTRKNLAINERFFYKNTLIGLIFAGLNLAISRIFAIFAKLKLAKTCDIADSRN